jgi:hypothetical protein
MTVDPFNGGSSATMFMSTGRDPVVEAIRLEVVRRRALVNTAGIAVRLRASLGDTREVFEALGLVEPREALSAKLSVVKPAPSPGAPNESDGGSAANSGPAPTPRKQRGPRDTSLCGKRRHAMTGDNVRIREDGRRRCRACGQDWAGGKRTTAVPLPAVVEEPKERMCGNNLHPLPKGSGECQPCRNLRAKKKRATNNNTRSDEAIARARKILEGFPFDEVAPVDEFGAPVRRCKKRIHHRSDGNRGQEFQCVRCHEIARAKSTLRRLAGETW